MVVLVVVLVLERARRHHRDLLGLHEGAVGRRLLVVVVVMVLVGGVDGRLVLVVVGRVAVRAEALLVEAAQGRVLPLEPRHFAPGKKAQSTCPAYIYILSSPIEIVSRPCRVFLLLLFSHRGFLRGPKVYCLHPARDDFRNP